MARCYGSVLAPPRAAAAPKPECSGAAFPLKPAAVFADRPGSSGPGGGLNRIDRDRRIAGGANPSQWLAHATPGAEGAASAPRRIPVSGAARVKGGPRRPRGADATRETRAMERVSRLAALMAHEIRNPLAAMAQAVGLLGANPALTEDDRSLLGLVLEELQRVGRITSEFLAFSPLSRDRFERTPVAPLLEAAASLLRQEPRLAAGVAVETTVARGVPDVLLDADRIRQVLWNLGLNAAEAAPREGRIRFAAKSLAQGGVAGVSIVVSDTGPGVPAALRERVFEAFETTRVGGTGLGLALARHAVALHGGWIRLDDAPGGGARIRIWLPVDGPDRDAERPEEPAWRDS